LDRLCPELLDAEPGSGAAERRVEAVTVDVAVALDLDGGTGREPGREVLVDAERELVEPEVDLARPGAGRRVPGELGVDLQAIVEVDGPDEESADPEAAILRLREPDDLEGMIALQLDLALAGRRRHLGRDDSGGQERRRGRVCRGYRLTRRCRRYRFRRRSRSDLRLTRILHPVQSIVESTDLVPE